MKDYCRTCEIDLAFPPGNGRCPFCGFKLVIQNRYTLKEFFQDLKIAIAAVIIIPVFFYFLLCAAFISYQIDERRNVQ